MTLLPGAPHDYDLADKLAGRAAAPLVIELRAGQVHSLEVASTSGWSQPEAWSVEFCRRDRRDYYITGGGLSEGRSVVLCAGTDAYWLTEGWALAHETAATLLPVFPEGEVAAFWERVLRAEDGEGGLYWCARCRSWYPHSAQCSHMWDCGICYDMSTPGFRCGHGKVTAERAWAEA